MTQSPKSHLTYKISKFWDFIVPKLPVFALILFIGVIYYSISSLIKGNTPTIYMLTFSFSLFSCGGVFYYLYNNKTLNEDININTHVFNTKLLIIIFVLSITFVFLILNSVYYVKPIEYYVLIGIAIVSIALQIGLKREITNKESFVILLQIITLATVIRSSSLFLSPFHIGIDTHVFHYPHISKIIESGHLNRSAFYYFFYPCYHLINSVLNLVTEYSINFFKLVNLCNSLALIPVGYLIGSYVYDKKSGLMCALLFSLSTMNIFVVLFSTSKVGGTTLLFLDIYILLKIMYQKNIKYITLFFICTLSLFLWHPEISAALFFVLLAYLFTKLTHSQNLKLDSLLLLYFVFYIAYNMYISTVIFEKVVKAIFFVDVSQDYQLVQNITIVNSTGMDSTDSDSTFPLNMMFQLFAAYLGISLPFFFVTYSFFSWIQSSNPKKHFLILTFLAICLIPVISVFSNNMNFSPARLLTYISLISLIITSCSIFNVFNLKSKKSIILFSTLIFISSIFSVSSYLSGDGSEVYNDKVPVDVIFTTHSNVAATAFINSKLPTNGVITTDSTTFGVSDINRKTMVSDYFYSKGYYLLNYYNIKRKNLILEEIYTSSYRDKIYTNDFEIIELVV